MVKAADPLTEAIRNAAIDSFIINTMCVYITAQTKSNHGTIWTHHRIHLLEKKGPNQCGVNQARE